MRIVVAPDSFKGSLTSAEACEAAAVGLRRALPHAVINLLPVADGGEGTVEAFCLAVGGERRAERVTGPYGHPVDAEWALLPGGTAVIETAQAVGLLLVGGDRRTGAASTYGVGELVQAAAHAGARRIVVGLGGSATTDGGCGAAAACGVRFLAGDGAEFVPVGSSLARVARVDVSVVDPAVAAAKIVAMCDVDSPLTGTEGAAAVFGPQKGAGPAEVAALDAGLAHLASVIRRDLGVEVERLAGAGAAGGMGAGLVAFLGAELRPGIEVVLDAVGLDRHLRGADAVVTGEGSFDTQSLRGKVVAGVAARARAAGVPVHVLAGRVDPEARTAMTGYGVASAREIMPAGEPIERAMRNAAANLARAAEELARELANGKALGG